MLFKKSTFYLVTNNINLNSKDDAKDFRCYTITISHKQAEEYIQRINFITHRNHFIAWCNNNDIHLKDDYFPDEAIWQKYYNLVWKDEKPRYFIQKIKYSLTTLASLLRMYNNVIPLGCSYETDAEYDKFVKENHISIDSSKTNG